MEIFNKSCATHRNGGQEHSFSGTMKDDCMNHLIRYDIKQKNKVNYKVLLCILCSEN